jgi:DNA-binding transcriptional MocR family regulator
VWHVSNALERGLDVLEILADRGDARVTELVDELGVSRATAFRILVTLENRGYVEHARGERLLSRAAKDTAPDAWRRGVAFMLDGLRTEAAHPLPTAPLIPQQLYEVMGNLAGPR